MIRMYERVLLIRPLYLDFTGDIIKPGVEAIVVDLIDDDVVLIEFDNEKTHVGMLKSAVASIYDFIPLRS